MRLFLAVAAAEATDVDAAADDKAGRAAAPESDSDVSSDSEDEATEMDVIAEIWAHLAEPMEDADDAVAASKGSLLVRRRPPHHATPLHCAQTL